jgi:lipopolysaccharide/colanic/teichoic acid biosynthesis glycosyltransferase
MRLRKILYAVGLGALIVMALTLPLSAEAGSNDSPEDPSVLLALVGSAGFVGTRLWRTRRRKRLPHRHSGAINRHNQPDSKSNIPSRIHRRKAMDSAPKRPTKLRRRPQDSASGTSPAPTSQLVRRGALGTAHLAHESDAFRKDLSPWSGSAAKRAFDCGCVLLALPALAPLALAVAAAVRLTSPGPVLFLQKRVGRHGRTFTIFKFRTMIHAADGAHHPISTVDNQIFTPVGPFLRYWKLDELPQLANVLLGHMSLVGPRPKMPDHVIFEVPCRPGITGMATVAFAQEDEILARLPEDQLESYYHLVVLPAKGQMDAEYGARATLLSDIGLLVISVLRRWDPANAESFIAAARMDAQWAGIQSEADAPLVAAQASAATQPVDWMAPKASQSAASAIPAWNAQAEQSIEV